MKKNTFVFFLVLMAVPFISLVSAPLVHAQADQAGVQYQLLEKIPGTDNLGSDLPSYLSALYKIALIVVTLSAVLMLSIGGFMYITSAGNTASIANAKGIITDSLIGLVIALSAWLVLYIINPDLIKINLDSLGEVSYTSTPPSTPQGEYTAPPEDSVQLAQEILNNGNIGLNTTGSCSSEKGQVTPQKNIADIAHGTRAARCQAGCEKLGAKGCIENDRNLSNTMLKAIWTVGQTQRFTITSISGGPHASNSQHYNGNAIDIVPINQTLMDAFVAAGAVKPNGNAASMCEKQTIVDGKMKTIGVDCNTGGANHIHLVFPN
jgi:hypothetical protein